MSQDNAAHCVGFCFAKILRGKANCVEYNVSACARDQCAQIMGGITVDDQDRDRSMRDEDEIGRKGGAAEAHMASAARPIAEPLAVAVGGVRWSSVITGAVIALAIMIFLNTLGVGFGLALTRAGFGGGLAYWMVAMAAIGLFIGSYLATRSAQIRSVWTGMLYALTVWAVFLLLDVIGVDLYGGLSRFFYTPGVNTAASGAIRNVAQAGGWWFFLAYLIGLAAALLGASFGVTVEETEHHVHTEEHH